jgi:hypothetical protein
MTSPSKRPTGPTYRARKYLDSTYQQGRTYRSAMRNRVRRLGPPKDRQ